MELSRDSQKMGHIPGAINLVFTCVSGCFGTTLYFAARLLDYKGEGFTGPNQ